MNQIGEPQRYRLGQGHSSITRTVWEDEARLLPSCGHNWRSSKPDYPPFDMRVIFHAPVSEEAFHPGTRNLWSWNRVVEPMPDIEI